MANIVTNFIGPLLVGGLGAGLVTFGLNFWKAERDFRRAKLEALYLAVHKYTQSMYAMSHRIQTGALGAPSRDAVEDWDLINLLIGLYFPRLTPAFEKFKAIFHESIMEGNTFKLHNPNLEEDFGRLQAEGEKLKSAIVEIAREQQLFLEY
jgi:hypothetical protein